MKILKLFTRCFELTMAATRFQHSRDYNSERCSPVSAAGQEHLSPSPSKLRVSHFDYLNSVRELKMERSACSWIPQPQQLLVPAHVGMRPTLFQMRVRFQSPDTSPVCPCLAPCPSPSLLSQTSTCRCRVLLGTLKIRQNCTQTR